MAGALCPRSVIINILQYKQNKITLKLGNGKSLKYFRVQRNNNWVITLK